MILSYRIFKTKYSGSWFDGEGAFRFGGRWNFPGKRVLYTAESLALTSLEMLVHLGNEQLLLSYSFATVGFDKKLVLDIEEIAELPKNWSESPPPVQTQMIGDEWLKNNASAVLKIPTAVVPIGYNYLINIEHPDFSKITLGEPTLFTFDRRLKT